MDNGASSYRRFLEGDDDGIVEIIRDYKDGLILFLNRYVNNIHIAEELAEDTFFKEATVYCRRLFQNMAIYDWPEYSNKLYQAGQKDFGCPYRRNKCVQR